MGRHVAGDMPEIDRIVDETIGAVGAEVDAMRIPRLWGIVLGGGYGRGEGGAIGGGLSNDLDFYVVAEEGAGSADLAAIDAALKPVSEKWTAKLRLLSLMRLLRNCRLMVVNLSPMRNLSRSW